MVRIARIVLPHVPHLVFQAGNRSERLFYSEADRERYLEGLSGQLARCAVKLWAYRLEAGKVFLVAVPPDGESLGHALRNAHGQYSQSINRRQGTTGHLFQGRFYSCPLEGEYLDLAVRYVERFTGRCPPATKSSAAYHCRRSARKPGPLADDLPLLKSVKNWRKWLREPVDRAMLAHLLSRLRTGKPAGSEAFVGGVERLTGLNLSRGPGRPRMDRPAEA
jgi:putative transposase